MTMHQIAANQKRPHRCQYYDYVIKDNQNVTRLSNKNEMPTAQLASRLHLRTTLLDLDYVMVENELVSAS